MFKLAVVDVSDGSDGEQARRQLIPLDQGAPGVQSGEEKLHQQCFLTAENVTLFTSSTLNLDRALSVTLFCLSSTVFGVLVISSRLHLDLWPAEVTLVHLPLSHHLAVSLSDGHEVVWSSRWKNSSRSLPGDTQTRLNPGIPLPRLLQCI